MNLNLRDLKDERIILIQKISQILYNLGITERLKGYIYIREAVYMAYIKIENLDNIYKNLYFPLSKKFNSTPSKIERCIRYSIHKIWSTKKRENKINILNLKQKGKHPSNYEFLSSFVKILKEY